MKWLVGSMIFAAERRWRLGLAIFSVVDVGLLMGGPERVDGCGFKQFSAIFCTFVHFSAQISKNPHKPAKTRTFEQI